MMATPASASVGRDELVERYLPMVRSMAVRILAGLPNQTELEDLTHAGVVGLVDAATKYDAGRGVPFHVYAKFRIRGSIIDSLRDLDWSSRPLRRRRREMDEVRQKLTAELQRVPTEAEMAAEFGVDVEVWRALLLSVSVTDVVSLASLEAMVDQDVERRGANPAERPDEVVSRGEVVDVLGVAARKLPQRYQVVIRLCYQQGLSMKEIGAELGIKESRVSQIHKAALQRMAEELRGVGIRSSQDV